MTGSTNTTSRWPVRWPVWQQYLAGKNEDVYQVYGFDGFHVDQVGDRGPGLYNYNGTTLDLSSRFQSFLEAMKAAHPSKRLVMNAVNQFGQQNSIGAAPVDFRSGPATKAIRTLPL